MKQRFSSLDVQVIAHELSSALTSLRCANIYDLSSRIFLLKFAKPDRREQLIVDSGFRCHLTSFARSTAAAPSAFVSRLRKYLRTRRVTTVRQIGTDRVIEVQFSDGAYRLFLEFYAGGNVVLTDGDLTILALLRTVNEGEQHEQYRVGLKYNLSHRQNFDGVPDLTKQRVKDGLQSAVQKQAEESQKPDKKFKKKRGDALRKALAVTTTEFPPVLIDHALYVTDLDRQTQLEDVISNEVLLDQLMKALEEARNVVREITSAETAKGYIVAEKKASNNGQNDVLDVEPQEHLIYTDFQPFKPAHLASNPSLSFLEIDGFNRTADQFFSSLEGQKLESRLQERQDNAKRKLEQARQEQEKRIDGLQHVQELNVRKAQAIEANVERIEEAVAAVNGLIAQGMDWADIGQLIANEQARHNSVAETIKLPLKLHENTITLLLSEYDAVEENDDLADETESEDSDTEEESSRPSKQKVADKRLTVDIDLGLTAWANATQYYDQKRSAAFKQEKTAQASQKALRSTEQKVMADLKKGLKEEKAVLRPVRKQMWFEKFIYFISSDGYLVLAGRDAQQNEMLYRRYLKRGDIYVHADLHGAATVIIKNNPVTPDSPIPPSTLSQAGHLAVCTSTAWDSKAGMSAWWVTADQVSKTAPTGEYLTTGGFMVRGKKNFLPPAQLLLGFAVLWQISEESKARHVKHRLLDVSVPETPDLTDGETNAESSVAGGSSSTAVSDDDFPDATPRRSLTVLDDSDEFQDGIRTPESFEEGDFGDNATRRPEIEDDDFPDVNLQPPEEDQDNEDDEDAGNQTSAFNPLQLNGALRRPANIAHNALNPANVEDTTVPSDLADDGTDTDEPPTPKSYTSTQRKTSYISAKQDSSGNSVNDSVSTLTASTASTASTAKPANAQKHVRGKRGKAKKAAAKYAEQDEEDREIAMRLLGSKAGDEKRKAVAAENSKETVEQARARRRAQHDKAQREGLEAEEIRRLNLEEGMDEPDEHESATFTQLDTLVGTPLPGDEILEAIPICAPWSALTKYKYKAKMQPGQQKKGKAVREILGKWINDAGDAKKVDQQSHDTEKIWPREADLIKGWKETEVVGIIPVKSVRVMMAGGGGGDRSKGGKGAKTGRGGKGGKKTK